MYCNLQVQSTLQVPNFLLAAPTLGLAASGCWTWCSSDWHRCRCLALQRPTLEMHSSSEGTHEALAPDQAASPAEVVHVTHRQLHVEKSSSQKSALQHNKTLSCGFLADSVAPHIFHWAFLAIFAAVFMHVQVATRMLSGLPVMHWYAAHLAVERPAAKAWLWRLYLLYLSVGCVLLPNFYPWT